MDDRYTAYTPGTDEDAGALGFLALPLAWLVPGLGHFLIGQKARGIVFFAAIHILFGLGMLFGGIRSINPPEQPIWTYTQFLSGWPMLVANYFEKNYFEPRFGRLDNNNKTQAEYDFEDKRPSDPDDRQKYTQDFIAKQPVFAFHPKIHDMGSVYCGIAGMLNLLVLFDVLLRVTGSQRQPQERKKESGPAGAAGGAA